MVLDFEFQEFAHHALDLVNARVAKFHNFSTFNANDMVVLLVSVRLFELRHVFTKLVLRYQVAGNEEFQCVVYGSTAYAVLLIFHVDIKRFHVEMVIPRVNLFKNSVTLGRLTQTFVFQIRLEYFFYRLVVFRLSHCPKVSRTNLHNIALIYKCAKRYQLLESKRVIPVIPLICARCLIRFSKCAVSLTKIMMDPSKIPSLLEIVMDRIFTLKSSDITLVILLSSPTSSMPTICRPVRKASSFWEVHLALTMR